MCMASCKNVILMGDLNVKMLQKNCLEDLFSVHGVRNMVTGPTFKTTQGILLDVVVTDVPKRFQRAEVFDIGLSDVHSMICFSSKMHLPASRKNTIIYRCYKHFKEEAYVADLERVPYQEKFLTHQMAPTGFIRNC